MHPRFFRRRPHFCYTTGAAGPDRRLRGMTLLLFLAALSLFLAGAAVFLKDISCQIAVSDAQYPAGMPPGRYRVTGADAVLEPDGLLWNPARKCLVGATTPMAKMMELLQRRIGLYHADCLVIGRDTPLALLA